MLTSTLFVTNVHCPSCVSYVQDVLRPIPGIQDVHVSIVDHRIEVEHAERVHLGRSIANVLLEAAFDVQHVTTTNATGQELTSTTFEKPSPPRRIGRWPLFMSKAERKHIENCNACRAEMSRTPQGRRLRSDVVRASKIATHRGVENESAEEALSDDSTARYSDPAMVNMSGTPDKMQTSARYQASLVIGGMTCASCVGTITQAVMSMDTVQTVSVDLLSNSATVEFLGNKEDVQKIIEAIEDIGYEASLGNIIEEKPLENTDSDLTRAVLSIEGMTCSSCVNAITEDLNSLPFVSSIAVNLLGNSATVEFSDKSNLQKIVETVEDLGYGATAEKVEAVAGSKAPKQPSTRVVQIQIDGMFCEHCPTNIQTALEKIFHGSIATLQSPTLKQAVISISYIPSPPQMTARQILKVIEGTHEAFTASLYHPPSQEQRTKTMRHREQRSILLRLLFTFLVAIPSFIIGIVFMSLVPGSNSTRRWFEQPVWAGSVTREEWALFIMTTPVMFFGADLFHRRAFKEIRALWRRNSPTPILRRFYRFGSMNLLISAGTAVAYLSSLAVLILDATSTPNDNQGASDTYFDSVTFLSFFILIGRFLEAYSKAKTGDAVAMLTNLRPSTALLIENTEQEKGTTTTRVSTDLLEVGDIVSVPHGESPPSDGVIHQEGTFLFDESSLTGESKPAKKIIGDKVYTGSVNVSQPVMIEVTEIGGTSMLDQIVDVVRKGQSKRAPIERVADVITGYFVPIITLVAILTWIIWLALGESGALPAKWLDTRQGGWAFWSLEFAIAVFVVACPCGIGLAAPTALYVGGGLAAKSGILVQGGGEAFQEASNIDVMVFDKTGTLTEGQMKVTSFQKLDDNSKIVNVAVALIISKALEEYSTHPIAKAIVAYCEEELKESSDVRIESADIKEVPGRGMTGTFSVKQIRDHSEIGGEAEFDQYEVALGNEKLISEVTTNSNDRDSSFDIFTSTTLQRAQSTGQSTAILAIRQVSKPVPTINLDSPAIPTNLKPAYLFSIADPIRLSALSVLTTLRDTHKIEVHMCTGDNVHTARAVAAQLNIPPSSIRAACLPAEKADYIHSLQTPRPSPTPPSSTQTKRRIVAFVGDGTNDTPALSASDVSIALSSGSSIALSTSSFILLNAATPLSSILHLITLSRRVFMRVKMNFAWALVYNVVLVPVAAGVLFAATGGRWRLGPVWASAAMAASSVSVVGSSLALRWEFGGGK